MSKRKDNIVREVEVYVPKINKKIYIYKHTKQRWRLFHTHPPRQDLHKSKNINHVRNL